MINLLTNKNLMIGLAVVSLLSIIGYSIYSTGREHEAKAQEKKLLSCQMTVLTMTTQAAVSAAESYAKRDKAIQQHETRENELKNDIDMLAAANQRLQLSALQTGSSVQRTGPTAKGSKTARTSACMSAELLSGCVQTIGGLSEIAGFADASRNAGLTCEATR